MSEQNKEKVKKRKKNKTLMEKIATNCVAFGLLSIILSSTIIGIKYYQDRIDQYTDKAYSMCHSAVDYIDVSKVEKYIDTHRTDEYYYDVLHYLKSMQVNFGANYFYIVEPRAEDMLYIFAAFDGIGEVSLLGMTEQYYEGGKEFMDKHIKDTGEEQLFKLVDEDIGLIGGAYYPMLDENGDLLAAVCVEFGMADIMATIMEFIASIIVVVVIVNLCILSPFFYLIRKGVIDPIAKISDASKSMLDHVQDNEALSIDVHTGDEVEELARSFERMDLEIKQYIAELSVAANEQERIGTELDLAKRIQLKMLTNNFPDTPEVSTFATIKTAKSIGGDYYDFYMVDDSHMAFVIAGVSAKGVPASILMAVSKTVLWDSTLLEGDPSSGFNFVNRVLRNGENEGMQVMVFEGILDLCTGELRYVNTSNEQPFIMKKNGEFKICSLDESPALGSSDDIVYSSGSIMLEPGDKLFHYTDGVMETANWKDEFFDTDKIAESLNRRKGETPEELLEGVNKDIERFMGEAPLLDDLTLLCLEYKQRKEIEI